MEKLGSAIKMFSRLWFHIDIYICSTWFIGVLNLSACCQPMCRPACQRPFQIKGQLMLESGQRYSPVQGCYILCIIYICSRIVSIYKKILRIKIKVVKVHS